MSRFAHLAPLLARWRALAPRERLALSGLAWVLGLLLVWLTLVSPALHTLRGAAAAQARLGAEFAQMQALQRRARALQARPAVSPAQWLVQLREQAQRLGPGASVQQQAGQASLVLKQVKADVLSAWLATDGIRLRPEALQLERDPGAGATWSGTLTFALPDADSSR